MELPPPPWPIARLVALCGGVEEPAFVAALGAPVLVGAPHRDEPGDDGWSFRTSRLRTVVERSAHGTLLLREDFIAYPLQKAPQAAAFLSTVLIGRARSNDVQIWHPSISKLHARVRRRGTGFELSDAGSSNGTKVSGERLAADVWVPLESGALVELAGVAFHFLEPAHLFRLLHRLSG